MEKKITRRTLLGSAGVGAMLGMRGAAAEENDRKVLVVGVACSPRRGMTTATATAAALEAAATNPRIETQLVDLGGMSIAGSLGDGRPADPADHVPDDFDTEVLPVLQSEHLGGLIIGSPCYYRCLSSLCMAFLERLAALRQPTMKLADLPVGALSVGAYRNGGQELVIQQILTAMLCHKAKVVGGNPPAFQGATLWNAYQDDITRDEFGIVSAQRLGARVAEAALQNTA